MSARRQAKGKDSARKPRPCSQESRSAQTQQRLLADLARAEAEEALSPCDEMEPLLLAYHDARKRGERKPIGAARLLRHLRTCAACREKLEALSLMGDEPGATPTKSHARTMFSWSASSERVRLAPLSSLRDKRQGVLEQVAAAHLAAATAPHSALLTRGGAEPVPRYLLNETVQINSDAYQLELYFPTQDRESDSLRLCADVLGDAPHNIRMTLRWGEQQRVQDADANGRACFDDLPRHLVSQDEYPLQFEIEVLP